MKKSLNEKCGVFGIFNSPGTASRRTYFGLFALQHRGQEQSGIVSTDGKKIYSHKKSGLVSQVYTERSLKKLPGFAAIGHNRYSTSRGKSLKHAQPVIFNNTVAFAHNGNLPSTKVLTDFLEKKGIDTRDFFYSPEDQPVLKKIINDQTFPNTKLISQQGLYLPSGLALTEKQITQVCQTIRIIYSNK